MDALGGYVEVRGDKVVEDCVGGVLEDLVGPGPVLLIRWRLSKIR